MKVDTPSAWKGLEKQCQHKSHLVHCTLFLKACGAQHWLKTPQTTENCLSEPHYGSYWSIWCSWWIYASVSILLISGNVYRRHLLVLKIKEMIMLISLVKQYFHSTFNTFYMQYHKVMCLFIRYFKDSPFKKLKF